MRGRAVLGLIALAPIAPALIGVAACSPGAPRGVSKDKLDAAVSGAIGDPATCVLIADQASGRIVYRYNTATVCARALPSCAGGGSQQLKDLLEATRKDGKARQASCSTTADNSRGVGWASGVIPAKGLVYAAVMEGTRSFPGMMISDRLDAAFQDVGLEPAPAR
jgi:hypothetical protein